MSGETKLKLDRRDLKILRELQADDTVTYRTLSKRVALSASACVERVRQMEAAGIISGYHASVAIEHVQPTLVMVAEISLASHSVEDIERFDQLLLATPEVVEVLRVNGEHDFIIRILLPGIGEWHKFAKKLLLPENKVQKMVSHVVMQELKPFKGYPVTIR